MLLEVINVYFHDENVQSLRDTEARNTLQVPDKTFSSLTQFTDVWKAKRELATSGWFLLHGNRNSQRGGEKKDFQEMFYCFVTWCQCGHVIRVFFQV